MVFNLNKLSFSFMMKFLLPHGSKNYAAVYTRINSNSKSEI